MYDIRKDLYDAMLNLFKKETNIDKVILFGSRAKKENRYNSDIDLAFIFNTDNNNDVFHIANLLDDLNTLYSFDTVNYSKIGNVKFKKEIDTFGITIYEKS